MLLQDKLNTIWDIDEVACEDDLGQWLAFLHGVRMSNVVNQVMFRVAGASPRWTYPSSQDQMELNDRQSQK